MRDGGTLDERRQELEIGLLTGGYWRRTAFGATNMRYGADE